MLIPLARCASSSMSWAKVARNGASLTWAFADSAQSTQTNKSRLRLLQSRDECLADLFATARNQLLALSSHEGRYVQLLEGIITQV